MHCRTEPSIIYKLKLGEMKSLPLWRSVAKWRPLNSKNLSFAMRRRETRTEFSVDGCQYYRRTHGPVYTVGSDDPDRIEETNEELIKMLNEDEMCDAVVMVFCQEAGVAWCDDGG